MPEILDDFSEFLPEQEPLNPSERFCVEFCRRQRIKKALILSLSLDGLSTNSQGLVQFADDMPLANITLGLCIAPDSGYLRREILDRRLKTVLVTHGSFMTYKS